ncbi:MULTISPECIES: efflux RND transporter permease subunit [unclassified Mesorhizobium]|uniref:efflux RND transporter permease subunit n=1 Tax=unclassified Mesorhizobium TaxID=325217 RepID=UPI00086AC788|nr:MULTISPECIES: efflux RND transporter permease subunit [unclassified Mesorhizobium]MBN9254416.1 efflux RND transporter permease subunit [Mesorhizobium sp.]ODT20039.1 MAG: multidrug efflux protein [Mesorhizobium sp. SCN 65-12]OJX76260.1 MAG: multidrug efflux protein [Mesorhizobium sp. 65-26]
MNFTDLFIRRPVLALVVSALIVVIGYQSFRTLTVRQFPRTQNAVVTVTTVYPGAAPDVIAGFITTPLENAIAQANGIDYMTSSSTSGVSTITVNLRLNYNADAAMTEINAKMSSVINQLPSGTQQPTMSVSVGQTIDAMYIGFRSDVLAANQITDYLTRVVQPKLQAVNGVQTAEILGGRTFALRAWLKPDKLAAYGLTAGDVWTAMAANNYISGIGTTRGQMTQTVLTARTYLHSTDEFADLVVKQIGGAIVRLRDVATVALGSQNPDVQVAFDAKTGVFIGIQIAPTANLLDVISGVRAVFPAIQAQLPQGLEGYIVYDSSTFVTQSINEVVKSLVEALVIVIFVVFAFLGSPRSVAIPIVAIPLSLIGAFAMMLVFGFSINLLTLLALVLAIGLVVDDAIIVVENVNRHIEEGAQPMDAAFAAARELVGPILAMTVVLIAVYVPIGFQSGLTGALFTEFAFTLVGAVAVSMTVALTLTPMLCSRILKPHLADRSGWEERVSDFIDRRFSEIHRPYMRMLHGSLNTVPVTLVFAAIVLGSIYFLYAGAKNELAPNEDQGFLGAQVTNAPNATLQQKLLNSDQVTKTFRSFPETDKSLQVEAPGVSFEGMVLKPWSDRKRTANDLQPLVQADLAKIAGGQAVVFQVPPLPGASGLPVQFAIGSTGDFNQLNEVSSTFLQEAQKSGLFVFLMKDLNIDNPQYSIRIDRDKASALGLSMSNVGSAMAGMLGGGYVNYFSIDNRSYQVIPQVEQRSRQTIDQIMNYPVATVNGTKIPLSAIATVTLEATPRSVAHFQQLNSATIAGVPAPGVAVGDALNTLKSIATRVLPQGYSVDYGGQSRQFVQESSGMAATFALALIIVFLALSAQFNSFRDPLIILVSVPMSIAGALAFISVGVGGATMNIYTQVGLVTLMGLISKHGILIVEVANTLQASGQSKREAIEGACGIRLRPILMTTGAMVLGVMPLILATGAGAAARFNMGLVIAAGLAVGTLFTLFVVPAVYLLLAADHHKQAAQEPKTAPAH